MKQAVLRVLTTALVAPIITSCSTLKVTSWSDPAFEGRALGKAIILGVAPNDTNRRRYEDLFAARLKEVGIDATTSYSLMPSKGKQSEDKVGQAVRQAQADSVIVTRIVDEKQKLHFEPPVHYGGYYGYYSYGHTYYPGYARTYMETLLETNLYDVESGKLVWTGQMVVTDEKPDKKTIKEVVTAQIKNWQKAGMISEP
jgi:hypothetical protein